MAVGSKGCTGVPREVIASPFHRPLLCDRVAVITGGGGDIGSAIGRRFAYEGAAVVVVDMRADKAEAAAEEVRAAGGVSAFFAADVSDPDQVRAAVSLAVAEFGKISTVVNTAAAEIPRGTVETLSLDDWNRALAVNLTSVFLMAKYAIPAMAAAGGGTIVNIASQLGQIGTPMRSPYSTSKAALIHLSKCLAVDHAKQNIRVNSLSPGAIDTRRVLRHGLTQDEANATRGPLHLLGRVGRVEEVAAAAAFLASDESSFITGTDLLVDGGYLAFKKSIEELP